LENDGSIDFAALSLCDALDLAVLVEEEARERYEDLARLMDREETRDVASFFHTMIQIEATHEHRLGLRRRKLFPAEPARVRREHVFGGEAAVLERAHAGITARQALQLALEAERRALSFFEEAMAFAIDPEILAIFRELRGDEVLHQRLVLEQLAKYPEERHVEVVAHATSPSTKP